jgi:hypothetical protein
MLSGGDAVSAGPTAQGLSFAEEAVWLLNRLQSGAEEDGLFSRMSAAFHATGRLDVEALRRAAIEIVGRHEVLRTSYRESPDGLVRHVHPLADVQTVVEQIDAGGEPIEEMQTRLAVEASRPFDLQSAPLWRFRIVHVSSVEHYLQLTVHHIVSDAWSSGIVFRELGALYNRFSGGLATELPKLPVQYAEYAARQRAAMSGPRFDALLAYWSRQLCGAPHRLTLPTDFARAPVTPQISDTMSFTLPAASGRAAAELATRERTTPFVFFLSIFKLLLFRWSRQTSIVVGTPMANRNRTEFEHVVGLFLDILALRTDVSGDDTFAGLLARVRATLFGAVKHADMPIGFLAQTLGLLPANGGRPPFFPVVFNFRNRGLVRAGGSRSPFSAAFQNDPRLLEVLRRTGALKLRGVQVDRVPTGIRDTSQFDITLNVNPLALGETRFDVIYNASLYSADRMRVFREQYLALVHHALADPCARIDTYPLTID